MYICFRLSFNEASFRERILNVKKKEEIGKRRDIIEWNLKEEK